MMADIMSHKVNCVVVKDLEQLEDTLLQVFAWYLYLNKDKNISISINGIALDYSKYVNTAAMVEKKIWLWDIPFDVSLLVWNARIKENFSAYYLDPNGGVRGKDTTTFNRNTVNFNHRVFVKSPFFEGRDGITLDKKRIEVPGQSSLESFDEDRAVLRALRSEIQK